MQVRTSGALAASLVLFVAGCGGRPTPSAPVPEEAPTPVAAKTARLTLHFKDWT